MSEIITNGCANLKPGEEPYIVLGGEILRFESKEVGVDFEERAKRELRETPDIVKESLEEFKKLLRNEPINYPKDDDEKLKIFLRPCKFYPQSALERMKNFYRYKIKHPKYYENLTPCLENKAFNQKLITVLPLRSYNGERILVVEAGRKWDTKNCTLVEVLRAVMLILEAAVAEPRTQISGVHVLLDMAGLSLTHVWQFTPGFAKNVVEWVQECIPIRLKGVHILNQPYIFNMVFALFKPLLSEKLQNRVHFHGNNFTALHSHVDPSILPKEYKGKAQVPLDQGPSLQKYICNFEPEYKARARHGYKNLKDL